MPILLLAATVAAFLGWIAAVQYSPEPRVDTAKTATTYGPVDIGFLADMAVHHDQAITMAQIALAKGPASTHGMAMSIMLTQQEEIGRMRGWLGMWGQPLLPQSDDMAWMLAVGNTEAIQYVALCNSLGGMPGMASTRELNELRVLEGEAFFIRFLQLMTRHHQGAVPMARFASVYAKNPLVQNFARRMVLEQSEEIARMVLLLKQAGGQPLETPLGAAPI